MNWKESIEFLKQIDKAIGNGSIKKNINYNKWITQLNARQKYVYSDIKDISRYFLQFHKVEVLHNELVKKNHFKRINHLINSLMNLEQKRMCIFDVDNKMFKFTLNTIEHDTS